MNQKQIETAVGRVLVGTMQKRDIDAAQAAEAIMYDATEWLWERWFTADPDVQHKAQMVLGEIADGDTETTFRVMELALAAKVEERRAEGGAL